MKRNLKIKSRTWSPEDWGENLYLVKVVKSVSPDEEITVRADTVMIEDGDLAFFKADDDNEILTLAISRGDWKTVHKADEQYQFPVSVERWKNVAGVRTIEIPIPSKKIIEKEIPVIEQEIEVDDNPENIEVQFVAPETEDSPPDEILTPPEE